MLRAAKLVPDSRGGASLAATPDRLSAAAIRASAQAGDPAVEIYPALSAIGIDGAYNFGKVRVSF